MLARQKKTNFSKLTITNVPTFECTITDDANSKENHDSETNEYIEYRSDGHIGVVFVGV